MVSFAERFKTLFSGMEQAHGCYIVKDEDTEKGKKKKGKAFTKREPVTLRLWENHLDGKDILGVIPIRADNHCFWGAIDIDDYDLDLETFARRIYKLKLPLFPMRSKSGGCHLVIFLETAIPAKDLQIKLSEISASLGYGKSEIFPKQSSVLVDKGDLGNWLNMPYFGGDNSSRYCLDQNGEAMSPALFLAAAERKRLSIEQIEQIEMGKSKGDLQDGPPCLQSLTEQGFPQGTRNNGLFALGVYCRKAFPDTWEQVLIEYNQKYMDPPMDPKEVQTVSKQIGNKDYNYRCNDQPICNFCNASVCRTKPFGVGSGAMPSMGALSKIPTDQPVWFLDINGVRTELTTEQLQMQTKFQKLCMDMLNMMPPKQTDRQWQNIIQTLLNDVEILEKPKEAGLQDQFTDLVEVFCADARTLAHSKDEIALGRPWAGVAPEDCDLGEKDKARVYFRLKDLADFLARSGFKYYNRSQMISKLSDEPLSAKQHFFNIKGKGMNVWHIREPDRQTESFSLPEMKGNVL